MHDIDNDPKVVAAKRQAARRHQIEQAFDGLPKRKSGEVARMCSLIEALHDVLTDYDEIVDDPPAFADQTATLFDQAVVRLGEVRAEQASKAAEKAKSRSKSEG